MEIKNNDIFYKYDTGDKHDYTIILDTDDKNYQLLSIEIVKSKNDVELQYIFKKNSFDDKKLLNSIKNRL